MSLYEIFPLVLPLVLPVVVGWALVQGHLAKPQHATVFVLSEDSGTSPSPSRPSSP